MRPIILCAIALIGLASLPAAAAPGRVGIMVDAGVPDGVHGSLVIRPTRWLHLHGGAGTNLISLGVRAGATLYLLPTVVSPTLSVDAGHYRAGDANQAMQRFDARAEDDPLLREVGYDYANLHLGLDLGRARYSFYLHGGMSALRGTVRNFDERLMADADEGITITVRQDPTVTVFAPSARIGMRVFF